MEIHFLFIYLFTFILKNKTRETNKNINKFLYQGTLFLNIYKKLW